MVVVPALRTPEPGAPVHVVGGRPLAGRISVQGSKNVALHLYAAALLVEDSLVLTGTPAILDTEVCARIIDHTGAHVDFSADTFTVAAAGAICPVIHPELGSRVRTTAVLAAAILARTGQVTFPVPGGDAFCARLIDRHLAAMQAAGAEVIISGTSIRARCSPRGVQAFTVDVGTPYGPSLGATVTAMLLGARAPGTTLVTRPSIEPEVTETARFLRERGVGVVFDEDGLHVTGSERVGGGSFAVAGDRIEAATLIMAAAVTSGRVHLDNITMADLPTGLTHSLSGAGIMLTEGSTGGIHAHLEGSLRAVESATAPHPGLPTDTAPQLTALLTQAEGVSQITERVYPQRDTHVEGLRAFGADVSSVGSLIRIRGPVRLRGADAGAADIRAVTALLIAALAAHGSSTIRGTYHLRRGYGHLLDNLATLGAAITTSPGGP
ncbi:UDP-N-acetylglucosamine 1-carboxyvinyltransferase [Streptomyces sp. NPDC005576]|uniref:UDP-N-acetylglucosamine 1-carboxyvinyltransferase n=1 Tax=Streptomyces sp. NPDC005576 TaxID=3364726 RepID=UPI0036BD3E3E